MRPMIGVASIDGKSSSALASDGDEQSGWRNEHLGIRGVSSSAGMQRVKLSQTSDNPNSSNVYVQIEGASGETHLPAARSPVKPSTNVTRPSDSRERRVTETLREQLAVLSHEQLPDNAPGSVKQMTSGEKQLSPARTTKGILNTASSVYSGGDSIESKRDDHGVVDELFGLNVEEWLEDDIVDEGVASVAAANDAAEIDGRAASKSVTATTAAFIVHVDSALAQDKISLNSRRQLPSVETTLKDVTNTRSNHISSEMRKSVESYVINAQSPNHNRVTASSSGSHVTGPNIDENGQTGTTAATFKTPRQIIADVKTPLASNSRCFQTFNMTSSRQTPRNSGGVTPSLMKQTPPLCDCGCRAKRKFVQSPGPNMGRSFFCCGSSKVKSNCKFFKWEPASSPASAGNFTNVFTPSAYGSHSSSFGVTPISVRPRCVPVTRVLVPPPKP